MGAKNKSVKNEQGRKRNLERYSSGENAEKVRARVRRYNKSPAGKAVREEYRKKNRARLREYMRNYFRDRRAQAKKLGLCANCLKSKEANGTILCNSCLIRMRENSKKQKDRLGRKRKPVPMERDSLADIPKKNGYIVKKEREAAEIWQYMKEDKVKIIR